MNTNEQTQSAAPRPAGVLERLQMKNRQRAEYLGKIEDWSPSEWATAVSGEVGELCNEITHQLRGDTVPKENFENEAADIVIYLDLLCQRMDIDLPNAIIKKFNKTSDKKSIDIKL